MATTDIETEALKYFQIQDIGLFVVRAVSTALTLAAILTLAMLLYGGFNWTTSEGDKAKVEEARNRITAALIGLAVVAMTWLIWRIVIYYLGIGTVVGDDVTFTLF
ncbi:hypothetical protein ACFLZ1_00425 [Patescibacteria group bacterium]